MKLDLGKHLDENLFRSFDAGNIFPEDGLFVRTIDQMGFRFRHGLHDTLQCRVSWRAAFNASLVKALSLGDPVDLWHFYRFKSRLCTEYGCSCECSFLSIFGAMESPAALSYHPTLRRSLYETRSRT